MQAEDIARRKASSCAWPLKRTREACAPSCLERIPRAWFLFFLKECTMRHSFGQGTCCLLQGISIIVILKN